MIVVLRYMISVTWAVVVGLSGGWLLISPWAIGLQQWGSNWTNSTKSEVVVGSTLIGLAIVGLLLALLSLIDYLKHHRQPLVVRIGESTRGGEVEVDDLLGLLARALNQEVARQKSEEKEKSEADRWGQEL